MLQKVAVCKVCYSDLLLYDSLSGSYGLERYWLLASANENCSRYMQLEKSNTTEKGLVFEINKALIVACKMLDKRHSGA